MDAETEALAGGRPDVDFNPLDPELADEFWPRMNKMRDECPVAHSTAHWNEYDTGFWVLNKHADVVRAGADWRKYSSAEGATPVQFDLDILRLVPLETDPPLHRSVRGPLNEFFVPDVLEETEPQITKFVEYLMADCLGHEGPVDFIEKFTALLPPIVFFETFLDQRKEDIEWVMEVLNVLLTQPERAMEAAPRLLMWCGELLEARRAEGRRDDVAGVIAHMRLEDDESGPALDERTRVETLNLMIMGGMETTMGALGGIAWHLSTDPALRASLRDADEVTLNRAVDEFLRVDSPVPTAGRTLTADVELRGCPMKAGDRILLNWAAANHDPEKFPNPDEFDLDRPNASAHVAFGAGVHRCLGNNLARREMKAAIRAICELSEFELEPGHEVRWRPSFARGPVALPIRMAR